MPYRVADYYYLFIYFFSFFSLVSLFIFILFTLHCLLLLSVLYVHCLSTWFDVFVPHVTFVRHLISPIKKKIKNCYCAK